MRILTHSDIMQLNIDPLQCYQWVVDMLETKNKVILPAKISMKPAPGIFYNIMPSVLTHYNCAGVKVVSRYPERNPSLNSQIVLYDNITGNIKSLLDGNYITTMRTGAVAAHSIKLLAKKNFSIIGLIGLGNQARATIKVLLSLYPQKHMVFKLMKYKDQHILFERYVKTLPNSDNIEIVFCNSYEEAVKGSDVIISSVTYFEEDICNDDCFTQGCLLIPIHTRGFMNCDLLFDKIYADDTSHVENFKYFDKFKSFAEVSDVLSGRNQGRESDLERIIAYNIGLSMHDVYFAEKIYEIAKNYEKGQVISLHSPTDKFWI